MGNVSVNSSVNQIRVIFIQPTERVIRWIMKEKTWHRFSGPFQEENCNFQT